MKMLFLALAFLVAPVTAHSQWLEHIMPDPHLDDLDHYQVNADLPTQKRLEDCFLFEAMAWKTRITDIRHNMLWTCKDLADKNTRNMPLTVHEQATEALLLDFEDEARKTMQRLNERYVNAAEQNPNPEYDMRTGQSLILKTGWRTWRNHQNRMIEDRGLDILMGH